MTLDIEGIKSRVAAATPGPWFRQGGLIHGPDRGGLDIGGLLADTYAEPEDAPEFVAHVGPDADFIAHARADIPLLIEEIERLRSGSTESSGA